MAVKKKPTLEEALARVGEIAACLEEPQRSLEESLKLYEEGVGLIALLEKTVAQSKLKLEKLTAGQEKQAEE